MLILQQVIFRLSSTILTILIVSISYISFILLKDNANKTHKTAIQLFKSVLPLSALLVINDLFLSIFNGIAKNDMALYKGITNIIFFLDIGIIVLFVGIFLNEEFKEKVDKFCEKDLTNDFFSEDLNTLNKGDAFIGYKVENNITTNKIAKIPLKDRFLHSLILGPTGCGKTSMSIIPMLYRDLQHEDIGCMVLDPKGDLAEKAFAIAREFDRKVIYFNPILPNCPKFNPLYGDESDVCENIVTTFNMLNADSTVYFKTMSEMLIRNSITLLKRLYKNEANLIDLNTLVTDSNGLGRKMLNDFIKLETKTTEQSKENQQVYNWFLTDYYTGITGKGTKTYEHCSLVRAQISKLISNKFLRNVLNPLRGEKNDLDFDEALEEGYVISMCSAQGKLRDLGRFLGYFLILNLQSSVFRRPGNENTRRPTMLFIDEFQIYANPGFSDMLTQGRSYRTASHLATQALAQIGMGSGKDGKDFIELVCANARNKIIYPGISASDAKYYSAEFGEVEVETRSKTYASKRFLPDLGDERLSTSVKTELKPLFTPTDIKYKKFGFITYATIENNSVQKPGVSKLEFIPKELNDKLDKMIEDYNNQEALNNPDILKALEESKSRDNVKYDKITIPSFNNTPDTPKTPSFEDSNNSVLIDDNISEEDFNLEEESLFETTTIDDDFNNIPIIDDDDL